MTCIFELAKVHFTSPAKIEDEDFRISDHALVFAQTLDQGFDIEDSSAAATYFVAENTVADDDDEDQVDGVQVSIPLSKRLDGDCSKKLDHFAPTEYYF